MFAQATVPVSEANNQRLPSIVDIAVVLAVFASVTWIGKAVGFPWSGPVAVVAALAMVGMRLRTRQQTWASLGLVRPPSWPRALLDVIALYVLVVLGMLLVVAPLSAVFGWQAMEAESFKHLRGNALQLGTLLAIGWTTAAFGEELLFRGFVLTRLEEAFTGVRARTLLAVIVQALLFGAAHAYLGMRGIATSAMVGVVYGAWFANRGRSLWPLFIAHGLTDTISLVAIYADAFPQV